MRQFGHRIPGKHYIRRESVHGISVDGRGKLLVVEYRGKCYLPGGGVEPGETLIEALHREYLEETGFGVKIGSKVAEAAEFVYAALDQQYFNKAGHFFLAELTERLGSAIENEHHPNWLTLEKFECRAAHRSHVWAVTLVLSAS